MFTMENTQGFTEAELNLLNEAMAKLIAAGIDEKNANDIINNNWQADGNTVESLTVHSLKQG